MATLSMTIVTPGGTLTETVTFPDGAAARLLATYKELYKATLPETPTNAQVFKALADGTFNGIKGNVLSYEKSLAVTALVDNPIDFT